MKKSNCSLVLGGTVAGYSIIKALHETGLRDIILFDTERRLAAYSNRLTKFVLIDDSAEAVFAALEELHREYEQIIIFPTGDKQIEQLDELYERIESYCFLPFNHDNLREFVNKINQYAHCEKVGVPFPKTIVLHEPDETEAILQIPFPILLKPSKQNASVFKNLVLQSAADFRREEAQIRQFLRAGITFLASELIPGDSSHVYAYMGYRTKQGVILNEWTGKKLSQYPNHFGVFSSASNQSVPVVLEQGRTLLETMNLYGICEPEFKYDPRDGTYKLTEVNLRSMMWNRMGSLSGVNLPYTQYMDAIGQAAERQQQEQTRRIHYVYSKHELFGLLNGTISFKTFWHNLFGSDKTYFAVFDPHDIKPFLADLAANVRGLIRMAGEAAGFAGWTKRIGWKRKGHA